VRMERRGHASNNERKWSRFVELCSKGDQGKNYKTCTYKDSVSMRRGKSRTRTEKKERKKGKKKVSRCNTVTLSLKIGGERGTSVGEERYD